MKSKWSNHRLWQSEKKCTKQLNENEIRSGFWSCPRDWKQRENKWNDLWSSYGRGGAGFGHEIFQPNGN